VDEPVDRSLSFVAALRIGLTLFVLVWIFGPYELRAAVPIWFAFLIALGLEVHFFAGSLRRIPPPRPDRRPQTVDRERYGYVEEADDLLLVRDGELPWVMLQLVRPQPEVVIDGNFARVDAAADLGRTVTFCAKNNLGGMEGLIGVPGTVGGALRMNAGAYGMQIGSYVREVELYRAATGRLETLRGPDISFEYRHTSFAPDDIMLAVQLELPSKPFREIIEGIRVCNEKRRSSQPLNQKSAGCIFKNPPGASAGRMIDELGLKGHAVGEARVSDKHANFFVNTGTASCADMLALIADVRERVRRVYGMELHEEVIVWKD